MSQPQRARGTRRCPLRFEDYTVFPNSQVIKSSDARYVRYPLERLAKVCPFFEGMMNVPQPKRFPPAQMPHGHPSFAAAGDERPRCPFASGSAPSSAPVSPTSPTIPDSKSQSPSPSQSQSQSQPQSQSQSVSDEDEQNAIDLPVTWGGLKLCLELVDAHITCPALGGTRPEAPSSLLSEGVEEHINAMVETAHAFGLTFVGNHVYSAFAGKPVPANGGASDPLWIFAVVAATGSTDVLIPAAWNTLRPDFNVFHASLEGKRLLLKFARDELRELYSLHHSWHYALQVYEDCMMQFSEWDRDPRAGDVSARTNVWETQYPRAGCPHAGCPHPQLAPVAADTVARVKEYLYSHPVRSEQSFDEIIDKVCDPVKLTDVIAPAMDECYACIYEEGGLLDTFVRVVQEQFVNVLKAEVHGVQLKGVQK